MNLNVDDVEKYDDDDDDDDDDVNSITAAEAVMSPAGVRHLRYTVTGLTASTSYTGRLRVANVYGISDWSPEFSFRTAVYRMYPMYTTVVNSDLKSLQLSKYVKKFSLAHNKRMCSSEITYLT